MKKLVAEYQHVFAFDNSELSCTSLVECKPNHQHHRRIPFALREKMDEMVQEMLEQGVVQHSKSLWASPVVLGTKHDEILCGLSSLKLNYKDGCIQWIYYLTQSIFQHWT